ARPRLQGPLSAPRARGSAVPFRIKVSLVVLALLVLAFTVGPLVVPIAPPPGVPPLAAVAGPGAEYVGVAGVDLHVRRWRGADTGPPLLLLVGVPYSSCPFRAPAARPPALGAGGA